MGSLLREYLDAPQQQDEVSGIFINDDKENITDGENGSHNDRIVGNDVCTPGTDAVVDDGSFESLAECLDEKNNGNFEVAQESKKEGVVPIEHVKETTDGAFLANESLDCEIAGFKSLRGANQKNTISEENGGSAMSIHQFKDVVAIVDPPRVGLHPIVSNNLFSLSYFFHF